MASSVDKKYFWKYKFMRIWLPLILVGVVLLSALAVYTIQLNKDNKAEEIPQDKMPYGSSMRDTTDLTPMVQYDERYFPFTEELENNLQIRKVSDYFRALQNNDEELFNATVHPIFKEYMDMLTENPRPISDYMAELRTPLTQKVGGNFKISSVEIIAYKDATGLSQLTELSRYMDDVSIAKEGTRISQTFDAIIPIRYNVYLEGQSSTAAPVENILFISVMGEDISILVLGDLQ